MSHRIHRSLFGFTVEDRSGLAVTVDLEPWSFIVRGPAGVTRIGLASAEGLAREISAAFARTPRKRRSRDPGSDAVVSSLVASDVAEERRALLSRVPGEVARVHGAVEAATGSAGGIHGSRLFFERRFLVADVLALRAAAIAVGHLRELRPGSDEETVEDLLDDLEDWPRLFSPTGQAYGSLRRTLARLPERVPSGIVCGLRTVLLPRPVTDPIELAAIALYCVAAVAGAAVAGDCFLFHVEHDGARATVEIARDGSVVEAAGPSNRRNAATGRATAALGEWILARKRAPSSLPAHLERVPIFRNGRSPEWNEVVDHLRAPDGGVPEWLPRLEQFRARFFEERAARERQVVAQARGE